jgi:hypothetical protein
MSREAAPEHPVGALKDPLVLHVSLLSVGAVELVAIAFDGPANIVAATMSGASIVRLMCRAT